MSHCTTFLGEHQGPAGVALWLVGILSASPLQNGGSILTATPRPRASTPLTLRVAPRLPHYSSSNSTSPLTHSPTFLYVAQTAAATAGRQERGVRAHAKRCCTPTRRVQFTFRRGGAGCGPQSLALRPLPSTTPQHPPNSPPLTAPFPLARPLRPGALGCSKDPSPATLSASCWPEGPPSMPSSASAPAASPLQGHMQPLTGVLSAPAGLAPS